MGGYFVINGNEKIIRMLVMPRRNHVSVARPRKQLAVEIAHTFTTFFFLIFQPICLARSTFVNRGEGFTEYGVQMRCVRPDESAQVCSPS